MIRNRIYWVTDEKEMALINPDLSFVAVVDHESKWTEEVKTFQEAIQLLRDLVESDGHHIFVKVDRWRHDHNYGNGVPHSKVVWCDTNTGKLHTKTIRVNGVTCQMIASYQTRFLAYLKGQYPEKYRYW